MKKSRGRVGPSLKVCGVTLGGLIGLVTLASPSIAAVRTPYMVCDRSAAPNYPAVLAAPGTCVLGLGASYYDVQRVRSRGFYTISLIRLHWGSWGGYEATAHGRACNVNAHGHAILSQCATATVHVFHPVAVMPAGGTVIYQRTEVTGGGGRWKRFTAWYQPGTDY